MKDKMVFSQSLAHTRRSLLWAAAVSVDFEWDELEKLAKNAIFSVNNFPHVLHIEFRE